MDFRPTKNVDLTELKLVYKTIVKQEDQLIKGKGTYKETMNLTLE